MYIGKGDARKLFFRHLLFQYTWLLWSSNRCLFFTCNLRHPRDHRAQRCNSCFSFLSVGEIDGICRANPIDLRQMDLPSVAAALFIFCPPPQGRERRAARSRRRSGAKSIPLVRTGIRGITERSGVIPVFHSRLMPRAIASSVLYRVPAVDRSSSRLFRPPFELAPCASPIPAGPCGIRRYTAFSSRFVSGMAA